MSAKLGNINLFVRDIARARQFYVEALGLEENVERSAPPSFILLQAGGCSLMLQDTSAPGADFSPATSIELGFAVDDLDAARQRLAANGGTASQIQHMGWGSGFDASDPDGRRLTIYRMRE